jgi:thiol-disulfide isomerase/thioredoxin
MKIFSVFIIVLGLMLSSSLDKQITVVDYKGLEPYLNKQNDTTYVVNFWATWCKPCVKELPNFEQLNENYKDKKVKVILVSLDFYKNYQTSLIPFIKNRGIKSEVILLHDPDSNAWIDKVYKNWSGAIPATLVYNRSSRSFYEQSFEYKQLDSVLNLKLALKP